MSGLISSWIQYCSLLIFHFIWMSNLKFNWIIDDLSGISNFLNLLGRYALLYESFSTIFSLKSQQIEVKLVAIDIEFNSTPTYTPFYFSQTLPLSWNLISMFAYNNQIFLNFLRLRIHLTLLIVTKLGLKLVKSKLNVLKLYFPRSWVEKLKIILFSVLQTI